MKERQSSNSFEEQLKRKAEGFSIKPSSDSWKQISTALNKQRRRQLVSWFLLAGLLVTGGGLTWWNLNQSYHENIVSAKEEVPQAATGNEKSQGNISTNEQDQARLPEAGKDITAGAGNISSTGDQPSTSQAPHQQFQTSSAKNSPVNIDETQSETAVTPAVEKQELIIPQTSSSQIQTSSSQTSENGEAISNNTASEEPLAAANVKQSDTVSTASEANVPLPLGPPVKQRRFYIRPGFYGLNSSQVNAPTLSTFSPTHTSTSDESNYEWKHYWGYSAGADLSYRFVDRLDAGLGIYFTNSGQQCTITWPTQYDVAYAVFYDTLSGQSYTVSDTTAIQTPVTDKTYHFHWIDLNASLSYALLQWEKDEIAIGGGIGYSRLVNNPEKLEIDTTSPLQSLTTVTPQIAEVRYNKDQFNCFGTLSYEHHFSNWFGVNTGLKFNYSLSNLYDDNANTGTHLFWVGAKVGCSIQF